MNVLVIDVGGTKVKCLATGQTEPRKFASGPEMTPRQMVDGVLAITAGWAYEAVSIGFPAPIRNGVATRDPVNLGPGWTDFAFATAFGKPVKLINDAALQAVGSYEGGKMLFLGLGTGLGSALVVDSLVVPLELAHLPYRKRQTYEDYVGHRGLERRGFDKWLKAVFDVTARLKAAMVADYVVLGGGNVKRLTELPAETRRGGNAKAFDGGFRLWTDAQLRY